MSTVRAAAILLALAACTPAAPGAGDSTTAAAPPPTPAETRARDSVLAGSGIPGAAGVGAARRAADSLNARAASADSAGRTP